MRSRLLLLVPALLAACGGDTGVSVHTELERFVRAQMDAGGIPGLAAVLIAGDEVVWTGTFGFADIERARPVDEHTPFLVASISKTIVSVLLMQLVEQGALELDASIDTPLGAAVRHPDHPETAITPLMLATHTSGVVDDWVYLASVTSGKDPTRSLPDFARDYLVPSHFAHAPGRRHDYSNSGIGVLGAVVESVAGRPFPELSRDAVFTPLGMEDTSWLLRDSDVDRLAVPYSGSWSEGFVAGEHQGFDFYPATSLRTSIHDLSRFLIAFMRFGDAGSGSRILSEETARLMREPQVPGVDDDQALVWYYEEIDGRRYLGHSGSALGASALMFFRPDDGVGVAVISNADAFIRARLGFREGSEALYAIAARIAAEITPR